MKYKLNGASQRGHIGWKWFEPKDIWVEIPHGDILSEMDYVYGYYEDEHFSFIKKFLMKLSGYKYYYSEHFEKAVVVHDSIIERYFDKIETQ